MYGLPFDHFDVWAGQQIIVEEVGGQLGLEGLRWRWGSGLWGDVGCGESRVGCFGDGD